MQNATISASQLSEPGLRVIKRPERVRDQLDAKINYLPVKRLFDILIAFLVILFVLSWMVPLLFILIRVDSPGPLFFLQRRIGRGGRSFWCYKFRTMVVNTEKDEKAAEENDERITVVGKFLRCTNLDEFPQFINIFLGSMSLVGPRPHMYADCNKFSLLLPGYKFRNMVKPGLTGLAQIKGYHGPALTRKSIELRYHWDNYYIRNFSFAFDCLIILKTIVQYIPAFLAYPFKPFSPIKKSMYESQ